MLVKYFNVKSEITTGNQGKHVKLGTADAFLKRTLRVQEILENALTNDFHQIKNI